MLQRIGTRRGTILAISTLSLACFVLLWGLALPRTGLAAVSLHSAPSANPLSTVTWRPETDFNEPANNDIAPAVHPTDPLRALLGGPVPIRYTTDGGATWQN